MKTFNLILLVTLSLLVFSCKKSDESKEPEDSTSFYLKKIDNSPVIQIEPELRIPIYKDLITKKRFKDAKAFLESYDENGNLSINISNPKNTKTAVNPRFDFASHVETYGWLYGSDNSVNEDPSYYTLGTSGQYKQLEAFYMILNGIQLCYESHVEGIGWQGQRCNGALSGTSGQNKRIEAIRIWINDGSGFVYYKSHLEGTGWEGSWKYNGQISGTTGQNKAMEGFRIKFYLY